MKPSDFKAQKKKLKAHLEERRQRARAAYLSKPEVQRARRRRALFRLAMLILIVVLLMLLRCDCGPTTPAVKEPAPPMPVFVDAGLKKPVFKTTVKQLPRKAYENKDSPALGWVEEFQLQVVARSPRLAECFVGVERPGALRWTCSINPDSGAVSEHVLEPLDEGAAVSVDQQKCLVEALSKPGYVLPRMSNQGLPQRVGFVLEF